MDFETPKTVDAKAALAIGAEGKVPIVFGDDDTNAWKSFRNLTNVHCLHQGELNTYDVLNNDVVVFTEETLPTGVSNAAAASTEEEEEGLLRRPDSVVSEKSYGLLEENVYTFVVPPARRSPRSATPSKRSSTRRSKVNTSTVRAAQAQPSHRRLGPASLAEGTLVTLAEGDSIDLFEA